MRFCSIITVCADDRPPYLAADAAAALSARSGVAVTSLDLADTAIAAAVASHVNGRDGALLVLDALGGGEPGAELLDTFAEELLEHVRQPMLVLGPRAELAVWRTLVVPTDASALIGASVPVLATWAHTFADTRAVVLVLDPPDPWPAGRSDVHADPIAIHLAGLGVKATSRRVATTAPWRSILEAVAAEPDPALIVVAAPPWAERATHWFSTSRHLIRRAHCPVLVVPATAASRSGEASSTSRQAPVASAK